MTMNTHCCTATVLLVLFVVFSVFADERYRSVDRERRLEQSDVRDLDRDQIEQRREGRYLDINRRANRNDRIERKYTSFDRRNRIDKNGASWRGLKTQIVTWKIDEMEKMNGLILVIVDH